MGLAARLNLKPGMSLRVVGRPAGVDLGDAAVGGAAAADGVLVFVKTLADVDKKAGPAVEAAAADRLAWIAYPKAGQLGTNLSRDILWRHLKPRGIEGVRLIAIDHVWSAMRFRPAK